MAIDSKYGRITVERSRSPLGEDEPVVLFRAQDRLLPQVIQFYLDLSARYGSPEEHLDALRRTLETVAAWQEDHFIKTPGS